jgi:hypothetical protein
MASKLELLDEESHPELFNECGLLLVDSLEALGFDAEAKVILHALVATARAIRASVRKRGTP